MASTSNEIYDRLRDVEDASLRNTLGLQSHEKECAIRYAGIQESVTGIKNVLMWVGGALLVGMAGVLVRLVFFSGAP